MSLVSDVTPLLAAADAQIADLTTRLTGAQMSVTALTADKLSLSAQVADLTARLAAATTPPPVAPPPTTTGPTLPSGWTRTVFFDDFTGTTVDKTKWNVRDNTIQSNMDGRNFARNCTVKDSVLSIRSGNDTGDNAHPWSCGYLDTIGKAAFQTGRWEARIRHPWGPTATGFWGAFWLRPGDGGIGEMDILEAWPAKGDVHQSLWRDYTGTPHVEGKHQTIPPFDPSQWHTYAVEKEPGVCRFLVDDVLVWDASKSATWVAEALDRNVTWNIRLNLQMGGSYGGKPTAATNLAQTFDIDWVRVLAR